MTNHESNGDNDLHESLLGNEETDSDEQHQSRGRRRSMIARLGIAFLGRLNTIRSRTVPSNVEPSRVESITQPHPAVNRSVILEASADAERYAVNSIVSRAISSKQQALPIRQDDGIDSFDYDDHKSYVQQLEYRKKTTSYFTKVEIMHWVVTFFIAVCTAVVALFVWYSSSVLVNFKFRIVHELIRVGQVELALAALCLISVAFVAVAAFGVAYIEPVAIGSGIPQIKTLLNGIKLPRVVRFKTLLVKAIGVSFSVGGGLPVGIEGPMIHSGAICGAGVSQGKSTTLGFDTSFSRFQPFRNDREKRDFVSAGAAAGVACAFGAPIGGVMFSLEEGSSFWNQALTWRAFFCSNVAYFVLALFKTGTSDHKRWGHLSDSLMFTFGDFSSQNKLTYAAYELPIFILLGAFGGVAGALYNQVNTRITLWRMKAVKTPARKMFEATSTALLCALISFIIPYLYRDNCVAISEKITATPESLVQFYCPDDQFSPIATLLLSPHEDAIKHLFHSNYAFSYLDCLWVFLAMFWTSCWTYGLSVPSGLFVPTLFAGAGLGRLVGELLHAYMPEGVPVVDAGTYALIGAAATLGGMARMTISLAVILIEATGDIQYGLPIMATLMTAKWVGDAFNDGLYDIHVHLNGWTFLEWDPPISANYLLVIDIMSKKPLYVTETDSVGRIYDLLQSCSHQGFPVVTSDIVKGEPPQFRGLILRRHLLMLLKKRAFFNTEPQPYETAPLLENSELEIAYPRYASLDDIQLLPGDREMIIDLTPYMNPGPFVIQEHSPATHAFRLFRTMGLRHLPVVNKANLLTGMVTRQDLSESALKGRLVELADPEHPANNVQQDNIADYAAVQTLIFEH